MLWCFQVAEAVAGSAIAATTPSAIASTVIFLNIDLSS